MYEFDIDNIIMINELMCVCIFYSFIFTTQKQSTTRDRS